MFIPLLALALVTSPAQANPNSNSVVQEGEGRFIPAEEGNVAQVKASASLGVSVDGDANISPALQASASLSWVPVIIPGGYGFIRFAELKAAADIELDGAEDKDKMKAEGSIGGFTFLRFVVDENQYSESVKRCQTSRGCQVQRQMQAGDSPVSVDLRFEVNMGEGGLKWVYNPRMGTSYVGFNGAASLGIGLVLHFTDSVALSAYFHGFASGTFGPDAEVMNQPVIGPSVFSGGAQVGGALTVDQVVRIDYNFDFEATSGTIAENAKGNGLGATVIGQTHTVSLKNIGPTPLMVGVSYGTEHGVNSVTQEEKDYESVTATVGVSIPLQ